MARLENSLLKEGTYPSSSSFLSSSIPTATAWSGTADMILGAGRRTVVVVHREGGQGRQPSDYRIHWWARVRGELASVNKSEHMLGERYDI